MSESTNTSSILASCFFAYPSSCTSAAAITNTPDWDNTTTPTFGGIRGGLDNNNLNLWTATLSQASVEFSFQGEEGYFLGFTGLGYGAYQCSYDGGSTFEEGVAVDSTSYSVASFCDKTGLSSSVTTKMVLRVVQGPIDLMSANWLTGEVATVTIGKSFHSETTVASRHIGTLVISASSASPVTSSSPSLPPKTPASTSSTVKFATPSPASPKILGLSPNTFGSLIVVLVAVVIVGFLALGSLIWYCRFERDGSGGDEKVVGNAAVAGSIGVQRRRTRRRERGGRHQLPQSSGSSEEESSDPELWNKM